MSSTSPDGSPTRIIAHRGASGYLPEHTALAKTLAYGLGADFIEQDLVVTRDEVLVVLHDPWLDDVSDVATQFPERCRADGRHYVVDFTFDELRRLSLHERRRAGSDELQFPARFAGALPELRICRFDDELRLIDGLNASTGRSVGIYPELKDPAWHAGAGIDQARLFAAVLGARRDLISGPLFIQSFDGPTLCRLRDEFAIRDPLVQLLERDATLALAVDPGTVDRIAAYADGVGAPVSALIEVGGDGRLRATRAYRRLSDAGLLVHPYTLRRDVPPAEGIEYRAALRFLIRELRVDALFCDHPDDALAVRAQHTAV